MRLRELMIGFTVFYTAAALFTTAATANAAASDAATAVTPEEHRRTPEQTFLTFPEWFLVHSPAEYAAFIKDQRPSDFPYFGHIDQFWQSYRAVYDAIR